MIPKPVPVRFYIDEDLLALGKALGELRLDVTYPGDRGKRHNRRMRPPCEVVARGDKDLDWIPKVAAEGWVIITRDSQIQAHPSLMAAVRSSGARMAALTGKDAMDVWAQLRLVLPHWDRIEAVLTETGPVIYSLTRTTFKAVSLE